MADQPDTTTPDPGTALEPAAKQWAKEVTFGATPTTFEYAWKMAVQFARSELVPKDYRGRPDDILVAMQLGAELGFAPMQSLQCIAVINGRPAVWGDGFLAKIMSSPRYKEHSEFYTTDPAAGNQEDEPPPPKMRKRRVTQDDLKNPDTTGWCVIYVKDRKQPFIGSFSIGQANRAGLTAKRDTPWQTYPDRMLIMRARSWAGRDGFAADLKGISTVEELLDIPTVATVPIEPRRASQVAEQEAAVEAMVEPAAETAAPTEREATAPDTDVAPKPTTVVPPPPTRATRFTAPTNQVVSTATVESTAFVADTKPGALLPAAPPTGVYEVHINIGGKKRERLLTEDAALADRAASCEGTGTAFKITWHGAKLAGKPVKVLDQLEAVK
jgi:RecT family